MTNILPEQTRKKLRQQASWKFLLVLSLMLLANAVLAFAMLIPAYAIAKLGTGQSSATVPADTSDRTDQTEIARTIGLLRQVQPLATTTSPHLDAVRRTFDLRPLGISVRSATYNAGESGQGTIVLSGDTSTRDKVNEYADALRKEPLFKSVVVPIAALSGASDGRFTITLTGDF